MRETCPREPLDPDMPRMSNILLRKLAILRGAPDEGNLAQEPLDPDMPRMSNILLRQLAILRGGAG